MLKELPLVSVLMTAFNRENFIGEAIKSVLASTYKNYELIIVDDLSTDKTVSIAESYKEKDERVRFYINAKNLGDYPNRNKAAEYAKGIYLLYVDSDDTINEDAIEYCVNSMQNNSEAEFAMIFLKNKISTPILMKPRESIHNHFFKEPFLVMNPGSTFLRKSFFENIGKYPTLYGPANDMYFNLKAAKNGNILLLPYNFLNYRIHEGQEMNNKNSYLINRYLFLKDALNELNFGLTQKEKNWVSNKNRRRFLKNIFKYFKQDFDLKSTYEKLKITGFSFKDFLKAIFH